MQKLLVIDKDLTLIRPSSGATFVQHPEDQVLIEGVAEAIDRYHKAGWAIVIASNQGGCDLSIVLGRKVPVGAYLVLDGQDYKITGIRKDENMDDPMLHFQLNRERDNGKRYYSTYPDSREVIRYKTVEDAIEEMRYYMKLIYPLLSWPQSLYFRGLLCPDFSGETCWAVNSFSEQGNWKAYEVSEPIRGAKIGYRKPQSGMIKEAIDYLEFSGLKVEEILFVGDRPEDQQAAEAANVRFLWANEWLRSNPWWF